MTRTVLTSAAALLLATVPTLAQAPGPKVATATASAKPAVVARGGKGVLAITVAVAPQFHINANRPNDKDLIPTAFTGAAPAGVKFGAPHYPTAKAIKVSYEKQPMLVYTGRTVITIPFTVSKTARPGRLTLGGNLTYQGCNATSCYPPGSIPVKATVTVK